MRHMENILCEAHSLCYMRHVESISFEAHGEYIVRHTEYIESCIVLDKAYTPQGAECVV